MTITCLAMLVLAALVAGCFASQRPDGGSGLLPVGSAAPDVSGVDQDGVSHDLKDAAGKVTVVYFYPKDATPGCTAEACAFRDVWDKYRQAGVGLFGVSNDDAASHKGFAGKHRLPFPLIADTDRRWAKAFGVPSRLGMYRRVSFLIGRDGRIAKVYADVDPGVHASQVLADAVAVPE
jgi:peroxiredoxin Q/BCP